MTVSKQCMCVRNQVSTFLSFVNKDQPVKTLYLQQMFVIFENFESVILYKSIHLYEEFNA